MGSRPYNHRPPDGNHLAGLSVLSGLRFARSHPYSKGRQKRAGQIQIKAGTGISHCKDTGRRLKRLLIDVIPRATVRRPIRFILSLNVMILYLNGREDDQAGFEQDSAL